MYVTHDGIVAEDDASGVDWEEAEEVTLDEADLPEAYRDAFDTDTFHVLRDRTIARPIVQQYHTADGVRTMGKPRSELERAAWSVDNKPLTLNHPDSPTGIARHEHVNGFWRDSEYNSEEDGLESDLYVPITDDEAHEYLSENGGVSIGFTNDEKPAEEEGLDGVQTNILVDHVAAVPRGRCSEEDGCSLSADSDTVHGRMRTLTADEAEAASDSPVTQDPDRSDEEVSRVSSDSVTRDQPDGLYVTDGDWFAVGPDEHTKDSTDHPDDAMFPVGSCSDVDDAWKLRNHAEDLTISTDTLEARIRRAGEAQDCEMPETATTDMSENTIEFDADDLTVDALAERHDGVAELRDERDKLRDRAETLNEVEETLDVDEEECACDVVGELVEDAESYREELLDYREEERQEIIEDIEEYTDRYEGEYEQFEMDELETLRETVTDVAESVVEADSSPTGVTTDSGGDDSETPETRRRRVWKR